MFGILFGGRLELKMSQTRLYYNKSFPRSINEFSNRCRHGTMRPRLIIARARIKAGQYQFVILSNDNITLSCK